VKSDNRITIILTRPRCGTHFIWSRLVESGKYQLIYDADRIAALHVLASKYQGKLDFLCPAPRNPNYNFQFNSLREVDVPLSAAEHLARLKKKYEASDDFDLFVKLMSLQDHGRRTLFSINRFVYAGGNGHFHGTGFEWNNECAMESLRTFHAWSGRLDRAIRFALVIRPIPEWIRAMSLKRGTDRTDTVSRRVNDLPLLLNTCQLLGISVHWMGDVVECMNGGIMDFEDHLNPLSRDEIGRVIEEAQSYSKKQKIKPAINMGSIFRWSRFLEYLREKDSIKRTSLVRSIGSLPLRMARVLPVIGPQIRRDRDGTVLNNARIHSHNGGS
jgi:hypothetical protein